MTDRLNLYRAWNGLGLMPRLDDLQQALIRAWSQPHRAYHTLQHLEECLALLDSVDPDAYAVEIALWFHDAVYDTHATNNELLSADWADLELEAARAGTMLIARVTKLIDATRHNAVPEDDESRLMVDIDLAILGSDEARFREYEGQVAREYAWVPRDVYVRERKKILQSFLDREHIYATEMFRERFEINARRNLAWSIESLLTGEGA